MKNLIAIIFLLLTLSGCQKSSIRDFQKDSKLKSIGIDSLSGYLTYADSVHTPLSGVFIQLYNYTSHVYLASCLTDANGHYLFPSLQPGFYNLIINCNLSWMKANATDALNIELYSIGYKVFTSLQLKAADISGDGLVNATDALWVKYRFLELINYFPAGDWVFNDKPLYAVPLPNSTYGDVQGLCTGNVTNRVYTTTK
jgi:hypothetical protein